MLDQDCSNYSHVMCGRLVVTIHDLHLIASFLVKCDIFLIVIASVAYLSLQCIKAVLHSLF